MAKRRNVRKKKKNHGGAILAAFIIFIMVGSGIGFVMIGNPSPGDDGTYDEHSFYRDQTGNYWVTEHQGRILRFHNLPSMVEDLQLEQEPVRDIGGAGNIMITFNPDDENIQFIESIRMELEDEFQVNLGKQVVAGITTNSTLYQNFPVIDCGDADANNIVIKMKSSDDEEMIYEGNCLELRGSSGHSFYRLKDRLIYSLTGIM